jgi:hypothetical protein
MRLIDGLAPDMRSLFEKVLSVMPAEVSRPIWDRYVEFEHTMVSSGGDLATVAKIEARRAMAFPDEPFVEMKGLLSIAHRYAFLDLRPPTTCDQSFLDMHRAPSSGANRGDGGEAGERMGGAGLGGGFGLDMDRCVMFVDSFSPYCRY